MLTVSFTPSGGSAYVLANGTSSGGYTRDVHVNLQRQVQVSQGLRWTTTQVFARNNQMVGMSFTVQRLFDTDLHATEFMLNNMISGVIIPASAGTLDWAVGGASAGTLNNAVVQNVESSQKGSTTYHHYSFVGTDVTSGT